MSKFELSIRFAPTKRWIISDIDMSCVIPISVADILRYAFGG